MQLNNQPYDWIRLQVVDCARNVAFNMPPKHEKNTHNITYIILVSFMFDSFLATFYLSLYAAMASA